MNTITHVGTTAPDITNESPETLLTGKRVRKKNPKYSNDIAIESSTKISDTSKGTSRPRKIRKSNVKATSQQTDNVKSLEQQKKDLELQKIAIQEELANVERKLVEKQRQLGLLPPSNPEEESSHYDAPTDDEDDSMDIDTPANSANAIQSEPIVAKPDIDTAPVAEYTPKAASRGGRGRGRGRGGRTKATTPKRKSTTKKKTTPKRTSAQTPAVLSRPKRAAKPVEPDLSPEFTFCREVLTQLMNHPYGYPFNEPVDPVLLQIPEYPLIIKHPMDFGTIRSKLNKCEYSDTSEFISDVNLVFNNACTFNNAASDVYIMAETLRKLFKEKIKSIEKKPSKDTTSSDNGAFRDLKKSVDTIRNEIRVLLEQKTGSPSNGSRKPKREEIPLTIDEMKKLSIGINSLSSSQLAVVVKIIKEKIPNIANDKEIEIDIASLDTATLRSLEAYVQSTKRKKTKRTSSTSKRRRPAALTQVDPQTRLELAKITEQGMQNKIESVERELEKLRSSSGFQTSTRLQSSSGSSTTPPTSSKDINGSKDSSTTNGTVAKPQTESVQAITSVVPISRNDSASEDSESESSESDSASSESGSDSEPESLVNSVAKSSTVETVAAPILSKADTTVTAPIEDVPRIISTSPNASEVNVDKIENAACWDQIAKVDDTKVVSDPPAPAVHSADATNLWSSFRDSHAQVQQKEMEKKEREEKLRKQREEEEERCRKMEEERRKLREEEERRRKQQEEEELIRAERELEEARLQAKRDRENKVKEDADDDDMLLNFDLTGGFEMDGKMVSDIRSSLKMSSNSAEPPPGGS